ncbi:MAG: phosphate-starvation-inducible E [Rhodobacteraceae bacterium]|nr:MAG: phosphate-starvation-inducible E [Paracoccaceae bacterium]
MHPRPDSADAERLAAEHDAAPAPIPESVIVKSIGFVEHLFLILVALMTVLVAALDIKEMIDTRSIELADILLMFLYTEVIAMVAVFYTGTGSPFIYPIFIAITALARLMVIQTKDMDPYTLIYQATAVLLLAIAGVIIARYSKT